MDKKIIALIAGFVVLVAGAIVYVKLTPESSSPTTEQTTPQPSATPQPEKNQPSAPTAKYVAYDEAAFTADTRPKVLFFHASWCPQCRALDQDIQQHITTLSDVTIYKVDYDKATDLRQRYGVTIQTTFVKTDKDGNKLATYVAYDTPTLGAVAKSLAL